MLVTDTTEVSNSLPNLASFRLVPMLNKRKIRVLLIDDDNEMSEIIGHCLQGKYNCKVETASDPFEAMNRMTEHFYDLIILDWRLPALTGGQTLKELERGFYFEPSLPVEWDRQRVPVIIFSSADRQECSLNKTKHFECVGFISKRQSLFDIIAAFENYLQSIHAKCS